MDDSQPILNTTTIINNDSIKSLYLNDNNNEIKGPKLIFGYIGAFLIFIGALTLTPLLMMIFYPKEARMFYAYLIPGVIALSIGIPLYSMIRKKNQAKMSILEATFLVLIVWFLAILFSAISFWFYGYTFTQGIFEATSGYTTTGLTILNWNGNNPVSDFPINTPNNIIEQELSNSSPYNDFDISQKAVYDHLLLFNRSMNQLVGGVGLVLIISSAISERSGLNLYQLEGHNDRLLPNLSKSARVIFGIYLVYIMLGMISYIIIGMQPFDAFCNAIGAVSTGGFSSASDGIHCISAIRNVTGVYNPIYDDEWRKIASEIITEILMLLGGTNFVIHYSLFTGKLKNIRHYEWIALFWIFIVFYPLMVFGMSKYYKNVADGFRHGTFEFISGVTTTGFQSIDSFKAERLPVFVIAIIIMLMTLGMQMGSTSGGIKNGRVYIMSKDIYYRIKETIFPKEMKEVHLMRRFGKVEKINQSDTTESWTYAGIYLLIMMIGSFVLAAAGSISQPPAALTPYNFTDYLFESASSLAGCGLTIGMTNNCTGSFVLWVEIIEMLFGRLEIFIFFTFLGKSYIRFTNRKYVYKPENDRTLTNEIPDDKIIENE